ncbi:hypothetical protein G9A89_004119 [Geosiphon pyriformis]|nr:hypothetical protein G9A89_004119 [Geosiphon pyriformis]
MPAALKIVRRLSSLYKHLKSPKFSRNETPLFLNMITEVSKIDPTTFTFEPCDSLENPYFQTYDNKAREILSRAASLLARGEVVAMPTETVYGLASNALNPEAVKKIFSIKNRPADNPLIVHISSLKMLRSLLPNPEAKIPGIYLEIIKKFWPGPLTILLPKSSLIPDEVTCNQQTVAVRFPSHPIARALITLCGFPLAAPSANISGRPSPTIASHVFNDLNTKVSMIIDGGQCVSGVESTVLDVLSNPKLPTILRPGGVTFEDLFPMPGMSGLRVYKKDFIDEKLEMAPTTPGMKYRHYSPDAQVILIDPKEEKSSLEDRTKKMKELVEKEIFEIRKSSKKRIGILRTIKTSASLSSTPIPQKIKDNLSCENFIPIESQYGNEIDQECDNFVNPAITLSSTNGLVHSKNIDLIEYNLGDSIAFPEEVARQLFKGLRFLDDRKVDYIIVEGMKEEKEGLAVMNRLRKAASKIVD